MKKSESRGVILDLAYNPNVDEVLGLIEETKSSVWGYKIHPDTENAFLLDGHDLVGHIKDEGGRVFLDGKWGDIPNGVAGWVARNRDRGVDMMTVHVSAGGPNMLADAARAAGDDAKILAITVLTSLNKEMCLALFRTSDVPALVAEFATIACNSGCHGIVCSPKETALFRGEWPRCRPGIIVNPGIRPTWYAQTDDQKRVATPEFARRAGASYIVVGRAIRNAENPVEAARLIAREFAGEG